MNKRFWVTSLICVSCVSQASAHIVNFEDKIGTSFAGGANQTLVYDFGDVKATFSGGTILTAATNAPADESSIYFSVSGVNSNPITIAFSKPVSNFFLQVLNGSAITESYTIADNAGHSSTFSIAPNFRSGLQYYSLPASGTVVTLTSAATSGFYDFAIDNVGFDEATPISPGVPEPATWALMLIGFGSLWYRLRRRQLSTAAPV